MVQQLSKFLFPFIFLAGAALAQNTTRPLDQSLQDAFDVGKLPGLHGTIVDLGNTRLAEVYFAGKDERWGQPLGAVQHSPDSLHDLRSVTKSVVGLLYGIALDEGKVPPTDTPLMTLFPEYADLLDGTERENILIEHALTMQMGLAWNEDLPYSDPRNSEIAMENAPDRYRYVLEQPVVEAPGNTWTYSGGAVALIGKLIADGTGQPLDDYARDKLFAPLNITNVEWVAGADGVPSAASGLRLDLRGLATIGQLVANDGRFDGQQIVSQEWLKRSQMPKAKVNRDLRYGLLWYIAGSPQSPVVIAVGNGGQRLTVQPEARFSVASFAGLYNDPNSWKTSLTVVTDYAVPAAKARLKDQ